MNVPASPIEIVLPRLESVRQIGEHKWECLCPAHDDRNPSLSIGLGDDGRVLVHCFAGCTFEQIVSAIGLTPADVFAADQSRKRKNASHHGTSMNGKTHHVSGGKTYSTPAKARAAANFGITKDNPGAAVAGQWEYHDANGQLVALVVRWNLPPDPLEPGTKPTKEFRPISHHPPDGWRIKDPPALWPLYRLQKLTPGPVVILEGEGKTDLAAQLGFNATTTAHGAQSPHKTDLSPLAGRELWILRDEGSAGEDYARKIQTLATSLNPPATVKIVRLPGLDDGEDLVQFVERRREDGKDNLAIAQEIIDLAATIALTTAPTVDTSQTVLHPAGGTGASKDDNTFRINAGNGNLAEVTEEAWAALQAANIPPTLFRYGAVPARIETDDDGNPLVRAMTPDRMRYQLARNAYWFAVAEKGDTRVETPVHPPMSVVRDVLATPDLPLPILTRIVECPIFARDGTLQTQAGYSPASKTYFVPGPGFIVPEVSAQPSADEIKDAVKLLTQELIHDFPFVAETDKAHALSALLCPFARELIDGPTPIHDFEAPGPGTGKTLLINALMLPSLGREPAAMTEGRDEDEWRKRVLAKLMGAPSIIFIDNVRRRVDASSLASAVTAWPQWEDRLLGKSEIIRVPVRCTWLMTGNNPAFSSEMARRTIRCRLDSKRDQPWLRTGFKHPNLMTWAKENRGKLVWAALTIIQAWIAAGRPPGNQTLGMFESWAQTIGGILEVAGVKGFLGNLQEFYSSADEEGAIWRVFVCAWWNARKNQEVKAAELFSIAIDAGMHLGEKSEQSQKVRLGQKINDARDRVFAVDVGTHERPEKLNLKIERAGTAHRACLWKLVEERRVGPGAVSV
jgi:hypothetical protein